MKMKKVSVSAPRVPGKAALPPALFLLPAVSAHAQVPPQLNSMFENLVSVFTGPIVKAILVMCLCGCAIAYAFNKDNEKMKRNTIAVGIGIIVVAASSFILDAVVTASGGTLGG